MFQHYLPNLSIFLMILVLAGAVLFTRVVITVPSGHVGVLWKRFGGGTVVDKDRLAGEGVHFIFPWDLIFIYDLRLQSSTSEYNAISKDGASLKAAINIRFRLDRDRVGTLHKEIGPDFMNLLVRPEIGSRAREIIAQYSAEDIYSSDRHEIEKQIRDATIKKLDVRIEDAEVKPGDEKPANLIDIYDTLMLNIELPASVVAAINRKIEQYYAVQEYQLRVDREKKESERKQVEADGIAAFQKTVSLGISDSYLRWRGIEATLQLAQSANAKVVVIGNPKDGLPIILGNVDVPVSRQAEQSGGASVPGSNNPAAPVYPSALNAGSATSERPSQAPEPGFLAVPPKQDLPLDLYLSGLRDLVSRVTGQTTPQSEVGSKPASPLH
jgi:regulator of protease activity HflC (stomatin/prohibitin superfamily)